LKINLKELVHGLIFGAAELAKEANAASESS
jgi:hypothetical protein